MLDAYIRGCTDLLLEGYSLKEVQALTEAVVDADRSRDFIKTPFYRGLEKNTWEAMKFVERGRKYSKSETGYKAHAEEDILDGIEFKEYVAGMVKGLSFKNYPPKVVDGIKKNLQTLTRSAKTNRTKYNKWVGDPDFPGKFDCYKNHVEALEFLYYLFTVLDVEWPFDVTWKNYIEKGSDLEKEKKEQRAKDREEKRAEQARKKKERDEKRAERERLRKEREARKRSA